MSYRFGVVYREDFMDEALESYNDVMRAIAEEHSVPVYDLARSLPKSSDYFYDDVHFNVEGAATAGEGLASFILEKQLVPRRR
jgi:lysophospholipase L1-like esterase